MPTWDLKHGDAREVLAKMKSGVIASLVCDPPAGISFMGKEWDHDHGHRDEWVKAFASIFVECLRVMKPGAHGLVWALPRTSHWTATALEDAGFEIRDVVMHLFGTGFPKSLNVGNGRGTALKPAAEHWILVRKPLEGTVAANVLEHSTGALNIDATRIGNEARVNPPAGNKPGTVAFNMGVYGMPQDAQPTTATGRWPANVTLDEEAAAMLGEPSRFFYVAKASRSEREAGLDDLPARSGGEATDREDGSAGLKSPRAGAGRGGGVRNHHPTVKSVALMRWLIRLITPPGEWVLDPFTGSGSTGVAAVAEGMRFIGIEREAEYIEIARRRIEHATKEKP